MKIFYENLNQEIKDIVQNNAKYQKVMVLFDDSVSNIEISTIYDEIKEICIYNQSHIKNLDINEIYNGYKLIIYACEVDTFLQINFDKNEFVNVFIPSNNYVLPYFLSNERKRGVQEDFMFLKNSKVDITALISMYFNKFFNYFNSMFLGGDCFIDVDYGIKEITQRNILNALNKFDQEMFFLDVDIIKKCNLTYHDLAIVDVIMINAFLVLITAIKNKSYMLVDVYKASKDNNELIEKFYRLYNNETLTSVIALNYDCLLNYCLIIKNKILELICFVEKDLNRVGEILGKVKDYSRDDNGLVAYLYLYNIFNV